MAVCESAISLEMEEDEDPIDNNNSELQEEVEEHDYSAASDEKQNIAEEAEMGTNGAGNPIQSMLTRRRRSTAAGYRTTTHSAWEYVGQFATEDEVTELRHRLKVAVNSCVQQKKGLKTYFYCTKRGSFGCGFQMYSMQAEKNGPIALYKSGQHNHAINKSEGDQLSHSHQKPLFAHTADDLQSIILGTSRMNDSAVGMAVFALSQQATKFSDFGVSPGALQETPVEPSISKHVLSDSLKRTLFGTSGEALEMNGEELDPQAAAHEESHQPAVSSSSQFGITAEIFEDDGALATKRPLGPKRMRKQAVPMRSTFESPAPYSLADGQSISRLIQIASELSLTITFNAHKHSEFCFTAGTNGLQKSVVVTDSGDTVTVEEMIGERQLDVEIWTKADFSQFAWAIKAKCQNALFP